ncbi:GGDEF domain-containing protein [Butyrivibrio sp. JL13D10]|uniref:GGDEF domain-containing protein n=1 Tax=Butyrivibrio sp. JL13D10 TaxID=3236815 RepID=UPI0038B5D21C
MNKQYIRKIIISVIIFLAGLFTIQLIHRVYIGFERKNNHEEVQQLISVDLSYSWDKMDDELSAILGMIDKGNLDNADLGRLYERASLIYMQNGEIMSYYRYLGYALYFLERSNDKDYAINVYLDLANFFLNNYTADSAKSMIEKAEDIRDFDDIENIQVKSYAYRMKGIMSIYDGDYAGAEEYLNKAQEMVDMADDAAYETAYEAIDDVWLARAYLYEGRYDQCRSLLDKWDGHDMFTTDIFREIFLRDMIIPYYHVRTLLKAAEIFEDSDNISEDELKKKEQEVAGVIKEYMDLCEANGYEKAELNTILELQKKYPPTDESIREELYRIVNGLYAKLFENQNVTYSNVIDDTVSDSKREMDRNERTKWQMIVRTRAIFLSFIFVVIVIVILVVMVLRSRYDGLTGILNRKSFNNYLHRAQRKKQLYGIIMIDVDDFKLINDSYGHKNGDLVLWRLGQLLQKEETTDVHAFRYGGEEFVMLLDKKAVPYSHAIAERLRKYMEMQSWPFGDDQVITLSIGIASGTGEGDILEKADSNLYRSKNNGKNQITDTQDTG